MNPRALAARLFRSQLAYPGFTALSALLACAAALGQSLELPTPATDEFHFVVLGDSQFHDPAAYNRLVDDTRHLMPAFVIQVGDMIEGYQDDLAAVEAEWERFRQQVAPLAPAPFMPVPGNHDLYNADRRSDTRLEGLYRRIWGETYYTFRYRNAAFIILNSDAPGEEQQITGDQWDWLRSTLESTNSEHIFVFMHRPPADLANADALHRLFTRHPVRYVFYGHHHHYHHLQRDGIGYVMTNAAADGATEIAAIGNFDHLLQVSVRGSSVRYAVIRADAIEAPDVVHPDDNYDFFRLTKRLAPSAVTMRQVGDLQWTMTIPLQNPTRRDVTVYVQCGSEDERWLHTPTRIAPLTLRPNAKANMQIRWHQEPSRKSESAPRCQLTVPYQTTAGNWLEFKASVEGRPDT